MTADVIQLADRRRPSPPPSTATYQVTFEVDAEGNLVTVFVPDFLADRSAAEALAGHFDRAALWLRSLILDRHGEHDRDVIARVLIRRGGAVSVSQAAPFKDANRRQWLFGRLADAFRLLRSG